MGLYHYRVTCHIVCTCNKVFCHGIDKGRDCKICFINNMFGWLHYVNKNSFPFVISIVKNVYISKPRVPLLKLKCIYV